jgi:hypothetical protein
MVLATNSDLSALPLVYAYRDIGVLLEKSRWKPRRVTCTREQAHGDAPGVEYVVKFRRPGPQSAAALISEVVSVMLLRLLGVRTLDAALVHVSHTLASSYRADGSIGYEILPGRHFGTVSRRQVDPAEPAAWPADFWKQLSDPVDLIRIWTADCWLMNLDRNIYGNMILEPAKQGKWDLIAVDHSDCFLGSGSLADGSCFERSPKQEAVELLPGIEAVMLEFGMDSIRQAIGRIHHAATLLPQVVTHVPAEWWDQSGITPGAVIGCLQERADRVRQIVRHDHWEGMTNAIRGGRSLGL